MYTTFHGRCFRYISPIALINQKKINQINDFLQKHTLQEFKKQVLNFNKRRWFPCCSDMFYLVALANYKTIFSKIKINYSIQHFKQMLKVLEEKYFDRLHILLEMVDTDFPLYSEYVQLMFKYMLDSDVKLSDCVSQVSHLDIDVMQLDYPNFLTLVKKMITYCKNEQLKQQVQEKVINRIQNIIDGKEKKLLVYLAPIKFYDQNELKNIVL